MSMSLSGGKSLILNNLVNSIVGRGVTVVTASGNKGKDACSKSPGSAGMNINVGGHGYRSRGCKKPMYSKSNYGKCVDIVAPAIRVPSASIKGRYSEYTICSVMFVWTRDSLKRENQKDELLEL